MSTAQRPGTTEKMLGFGGLMLAIAGALGILWLSEAVSGHAGVLLPTAIGLIAPIVIALALTLTPATRNNSLIWLLTGVWTGFLAALTIWSVGIIFLIATVFLLAAFLNANW